MQMSPMIGAAAMALSSFTVCMNALRLNLFDMHSAKHDRKLRKPALPEEALPAESTVSTEPAMQVLKVKGMMCPHCEMTVKNALEALPGVEEATASFEKGTVELKCSAGVPEKALKEAIEAKGYKYLSQQVHGDR